ncbi:MAG: hypothetical protein DHS20C20_03840 [Ardenticatenaceae bacterium]|nr:MAG: hypothetical protein DHS20C20_03840 [Ardenticatenaceae bacterium]
MIEEHNQKNSNQERMWRWGCGCLGMMTCLVVMVILLVLVGGLFFGLLFTAPPLEFMDGFNQFLENDVGWLVTILAIISLVAGGFIGSFIGKLIASARSDS